MGTLGILISLALTMYVLYRGWHVYYVVIPAAIIVILTNSMPFVDSIMEVFLPGCMTYGASYWLMFVFGIIVGRLYSDSGAALSIANSLGKVILRNEMTQRKRVFRVILLTILMCFILTYGGVHLTVLIFTLYPIILPLFQEAGIPRRHTAGVLSGGLVSCMAGAGSPQIANVVATQIMGISPKAGIGVSVVALAVQIAAMIFISDRYVWRTIKKGETFELGPKDVPIDRNMKTPHVVVALLPMVVIMVLYILFNVQITIAQLFGCIVALIVFYPYYRRVGNPIELMNAACPTAGVTIMTVGSVLGYGAVVKSAPAFQGILDFLVSLPLPDIFLVGFIVTCCAAFAGSAGSGIMLILPTIGPIFLGRGMTAVAIARISAFASGVLDTLPCNGSVLLILEYTGLKFKDGYPAYFLNSVVATGCGWVACMLYYAIVGM